MTSREAETMKHRIRAAAIITRGDAILLVQHVHPKTDEEWWVPPGGGVEPEDKSVFDCARREVFEETGLTVDLTDIVYLREFLDQENQNRNIEIFIGSRSATGELTIRNVQGSGPDEHYIRDVRWVSKAELQDMVVYPEILKDKFWDDLAEGLPAMQYLGVQIG
jgi:8-oxo-dGTP pyrophosphatase MutT (NUDIX family)